MSLPRAQETPSANSKCVKAANNFNRFRVPPDEVQLLKLGRVQQTASGAVGWFRSVPAGAAAAKAEFSLFTMY